MSKKGIAMRKALPTIIVAVAILSLLSTGLVLLNTQAKVAVLENDVRALEAELDIYKKRVEGAHVEVGSTEVQQLQPTMELTLQTSFSNGKFKFIGLGHVDGENPTLHVKVGDTVKIVLVNGDGVEHDFVIHELAVQSDYFHVKGDRTSVIFKAERPGVFHYYCSIPGHRELGMEGTIIVEAN